ncbi:MAG TPA: DNA primase [Candidatus Merdivicinus excrementipullorum]|uniref:DNA primase n=1 Tax=Candidatus Merdivicinus excrementipullorum TaxID=2840867 RepID=A0A9D1FNX3_9FIRM|nr:DNA primase [Candidatus Merdivicinus excrementipullorum]
MAIPRSFIENLRMSCDMENIVSSYVKLKRQGRNLAGLCPFHSEKTPSMVVYPDTQSFFCFGCGAGGDVISFIMRIENLDYVEAVKFLAQRVGMTVPEGETEDRASRMKPIILEINRLTARFYHDILKSPDGEPGRAYFAGRQLTPKTMVKYGLGYAPNTWDALRNYLKEKGFSYEQMAEAGVVNKGRSGSYYDAFRNRVMFPIIDLRKNVIGFGGRVLDDSKPKYLNTNDTLVFKKSRNLFSLNFAKNHTDGRLILAEGYMDVIAVNQAGFENVVATLGTALTPEQARLIAGYAKEVIIAYDSDGAGRKATDRAVGLLEEAGVSAKILQMRGAKDPDEYIKKFGAQRFKLLLDGAGNVTAYRLGDIRSRYDLETPEGRSGYLTEALKYLATLKSPVEREVYAGELASQTGILRETVLSNLEWEVKKNFRREKKKEWQDIASSRELYGDRVNPQRASNLSASLAEEGIIAFLFKNPDYLARILEKTGEEQFVTDFNRKLFHSLVEKLRLNGGAALSDFAGELSPEEMGRLSAIVNRDLPMTEQVLEDYIRGLEDAKCKNISKKAGELSREELLAAVRELQRKKRES